MIWAFVFLAIFCLAPAPAEAGVVAAAISAINAFAASSALAAFVVRTGLALAASGLARVIAGKKQVKASGGIKTSVSTSGGANSQTFLLGRVATAGNLAAPPMTGPPINPFVDEPNKNLYYVLDVSDVPGVTLEKVIVNGSERSLTPVGGGTWALRGMFYKDFYRLNVNYYDGSQTAADPKLLAAFSGASTRPWLADMVGDGVCYAVVNFNYRPELFSGLPAVRFECLGIPLYDPRLDDTVGGTGSHRWDDPATWSQTENPAVMSYNILRGIALPDGSVYGGGYAADELPLSDWFAAMNVCDEVVTTASGDVARYRAGLEVRVAEDEPLDVVAELLKACGGEFVEFGGVAKIHVGPPPLPVLFVTDEDLVVDDPEHLLPHPGQEAVFNAIHATYPEPAAAWEVKDAPPLYNPTWEAEDGDRRLVAEVALSAVPYVEQVQRLMSAWIKDERRMRRHTLTLPPEAAVLEPLDTIAWTSARNGYTSKLFEVGPLEDRLDTLLQHIAIRERDPSDNDWSVGDEVQVIHPSTDEIGPDLRAIQGFSVDAVAIEDEAGGPRRPGIQLTWDTSLDLSEVVALEYEVRPQGRTVLVAVGAVTQVSDGAIILSSGLVPGGAYEVRARFRTFAEGGWTVWHQVTVGNYGFTSADLDAEVTGAISAAQAAADAAGDAAAQALLDAEAVQDNLTALIGGYGGTISDLQEGVEDGLQPLGLSVLRAPAALWTHQSNADEATLTKAEIPSSEGVFVTDDAEFGEAFRFTAGINQSIGPAYPFEFVEGRVYKLTVRARCADDGGTAGATMRLGVCTQSGTAKLEANQQADYDGLDPLAVADGVAVFSVYVSTDATAMTDYGVPAAAQINLTAQGANWIYPFVRQNGGGATLGQLVIANLEWRDVTEVTEQINAVSAQVGANSASLLDLYDLNVSGSTAFGTLMGQLQVNAGGTSAAITDLQAVAADVDGFAQAFAGVTVTTNGGNVAGFVATSWDNPSGSGATLQLLGDVIVEKSLTASRLVLTDLTGNGVENGNFETGDAQGWAGLAPTFSVATAGSTGYSGINTDAPTKYLGKLAEDATFRTVFTDMPMPCDPGELWVVSARAGTGGSPKTARLGLGVLYYDRDDNQIDVQAATVTVDNTSFLKYNYAAPAAPAGTAYVRFRIHRSGGDSGDLFFTGVTAVKQRAGTTLLTPNSVSSAEMAAGSITAGNGAIANLTVGTLEIQNNAVTNGVSSNTTLDGGYSNENYVETYSITASAAATPVQLWYRGLIRRTAGSGTVTIKVLWNGDEFDQISKTIDGTDTDLELSSMQGRFSLAGNNNLKLRFEIPAGVTCTLFRGPIFMLELKK